MRADLDRTEYVLPVSKKELDLLLIAVRAYRHQRQYRDLYSRLVDQRERYAACKAEGST